MGFFDNGLFGILPKAEKDTKNAQVAQQQYGANSGVTTVQGFVSGKKSLSEKDIISIPAARAAIEIITNAVSNLPIKLARNVDTKQGKEFIDDDYRLIKLNESPNPTLSGSNFKKRMIKDMLLYGSSKNYVTYNDDGTIESIFPLDMEKLTTTVYSENGYEYYGIDTLMTNTGTTEFYDELLFTVLKDTDDGIIGKGVIEGNEDTFSLAIKQLQYESSLVGNGAMPTGMLTYDKQSVKDTILQKLSENFNNLYSGSKNVGKTIVVGGDMKYQALSLNPDNLQLTAGKKSVIADIARIFNIPESMINASANKYNSIEQNNLWFLTYTLAPLLSSIEISLNRNFLTDEEKQQGFEYQFDTSSVSRITPTELQKNVLDAFKGGLLSNIAARRKIGETVDEDEQEYFNLSTGTVLYIPESDRIINPNMGQIMDYETGEVLGEGYESGGDKLDKPLDEKADKGESNNEEKDGN